MQKSFLFTPILRYTSHSQNHSTECENDLMTGYRKANFHFEQSSTVEQTVGAVDSTNTCSRHACLIAMLSSLRPWIDVFALPEKINMAMTESDPDPKVRKMSITFYWLYATSELRMLAWNWNATDYKKLFLTWFFTDISLYDSPKKCPPILYAVNLWLKHVSATGATCLNTLSDFAS